MVWGHQAAGSTPVSPTKDKMKYKCKKCNVELIEYAWDCHRPLETYLQCPKCKETYDPCTKEFFGKRCRKFANHNGDHVTKEGVVFQDNLIGK